MITLHFVLADHWNSLYQLLHQNKAIALESQGGDLLETTGMVLWWKIEEDAMSGYLWKDIVDGLMAMYDGVNGQLIPRVKAFTDTIPISEPDRWSDPINGIYYRVKDLSHAQCWYGWVGLVKMRDKYTLAKQLSTGIASRIRSNGYKIMWDGEVTYSGDFLPIYPSNAHLRAMSMAKFYDKTIPLRAWIVYWTLPLWTWFFRKKRLFLKQKYNETDAFNTCICLYFMGKKRKLKAHLKRWPEMVTYLETLYNQNTPTDADVIQNDMKWYFTKKFQEYVL